MLCLNIFDSSSITSIAIIFYIINSYGWYRVYMISGYENDAWLAWVPIINCYMYAKFMQEYNKSGEWCRWVLAVYWIGSLLMEFNILIRIIGFIFITFNKLKLLFNLRCNPFVYLVMFIFPVILPFMLIGRVKKYMQKWNKMEVGYSDIY